MRRRALWVLIGVFVLGVGTGAFLDRACLKFHWCGHRGWRGGGETSLEKRQARILNFMVRRLDLSDDQRASIEPILSETWRDVSALGLGFMDRMEALLQQHADRIRLQLRPGQVEKFDRIVDRFTQKIPQVATPPGPGPDSPLIAPFPPTEPPFVQQSVAS